MVHHMRSKWLAGTGAVLLALSMTGLAAAATIVDDTTPATVATFEDLNGNGIDDDCETAVLPNLDAVTLAMAAVDANADGVISTTEAAQSDWVGGANCNHGGYVSTVANSTVDGTSDTTPEACDPADAPEVDAPEATTDENDQGQDETDSSNLDSNHAALETSTDSAPVATGTDCSTEPSTAETDSAAKDAARAACEAALAAGTPIVLAPMTHVEFAQSDVIGGKNCNHGGAVSDANKAAKAEKDAAKLAARQARLAAHAAKSHGKHGKHGQN
jgi:hypothetical protein